MGREKIDGNGRVRLKYNFDSIGQTDYGNIMLRWRHSKV